MLKFLFHFVSCHFDFVTDLFILFSPLYVEVTGFTQSILFGKGQFI